MARAHATDGRIRSAGLNLAYSLFVRGLRRNREDKAGNGDTGYRHSWGVLSSIKRDVKDKEMGIDRSQDDFLRSSPLRLGEAVLPFLYSSASLVQAGNAIELERAASQGG